MRRRRLNSGYSGNTDQRRTKAGTISMSKHNMERSLVAFTFTALDADAAAYITAFETADAQALEDAVVTAINDFVVGCKADGIWTAMKATCILAGARTLAGALIPLKGTAPTNVNFVAGDYNRKTGLVGDASTKYLNSNRSYTADPQNSFHSSVYVSTAGSADTQMYIGGQGTNADCVNDIYRQNGMSIRNRGDSGGRFGNGSSTGFMGSSRNSSSSYSVQVGGTSTASATNSVSLSTSQSLYLFARNNNGSMNLPSNARLAFYSIGEALDLALFNTRVTNLINAYAAAIA